MAATLNQIISGSLTLSTALSDQVISSVDLTKSFIVFGTGITSPAGDDVKTGFVTAQLTSSTNARFQRDTTSSNIAIDYRIVEFLSGVTVQRGSQSLAAAVDIGDRYAETVTISSVDLTKTFPILSLRNSSVPLSNNEMVVAEFISDTQLRLSMDDANTLPASLVCEWQVVEFQDNTLVQNFTGNMTGVSEIIAISAVDLSRSAIFLTFSAASDTSIDADSLMLRARFNSNSQIELIREANAVGVLYSVFVVEFENAFVTTVDVPITNGNNSNTATFPQPLVNANSIFYSTGLYGFGSLTTTNTITFAASLGRVSSFVEPDQITVSTGDYTNGNRTFTMQGIQFFTSSSSPYLSASGSVGAGSPFIF